MGSHNAAARVQSFKVQEQAERPEVRCENCDFVIFDGLIIKGRIVRVMREGAEAKCKRCRSWTPVPVTYCG